MLDDRIIENSYTAMKPEERTAWANRIKQMRADRRGIYSTEEGLEILTQMVKDSGLFTDTGEDTSRNFVIRILESMGILDGGNIKQIVRFMVKNTSVFPKAVADLVAEEEKNR